VRADLGITIGTGVSAWADQSGNGVNFVQPTGAAQPALVAGAINGQPAVLGDGADDTLRAVWARLAPSVQPFYVWAVYKQVTWSSGDCLMGDLSGVGLAFQQAVGATPTVSQFNGSHANLNTAAVLGAYVRSESSFNNTVGSYQKIGATQVTGGNPGNAIGGGTFALFSIGAAGTNCANLELAEAFVFPGEPTAGQRADLDAYCTARYGAGLV
jgi:hypothetical protein